MKVEPRIREWVAAALGPVAGPGGGWERLDAAGGSSRVWSFTSAEGRALIIKQHRSVRAFAQERRALEGWFGPGQPRTCGGARVPRPIAAEPGLRAMILDRLPGAAPGEDGEDGERVHEAAGRFLAAVHGLPIPDDDPLSLAEALPRRLRSWLARVELTPAQRRLVAEHGPRPELFASARRVPCHRDFEPRNWLWAEGRLGVVDFEHARPDFALVDLAKLVVGSWRRRPELGAAFLRGYRNSAPWTELERGQLRAVLVIHAVASLAWGRAHDEPAYVREGRSALDPGLFGRLEL